MSTFKDKIEAAVRAEGSQAKLATRLGVSQQQISYLINDATRISAEMAVRVETVLGIPRHELRPDLFPSHPESASI